MKKIVVIFLVLLTITSCSSKNSEESKTQSSDQGKGITMAVNESEFAKTFFQFQGNEQYSGYYDTESLDIANPQIRWQIKLENDYGGNVGSIIHGKIIYMASWGKIYGIDRVKGKILWEYDPEHSISGGIIYYNGIIIVWDDSAENERNIYAINAENGEMMWIIKDNGSVVGMPIVKNDILIFRCWYYSDAFPITMYKGVNVQTGEVLWKFYTTKERTEAPYYEKDIVWPTSAPFFYENEVYIIFGDHLEIINVNTGKTDSKIEFDKKIDSGASHLFIENHLIYIATGTILYCYDFNSKKLKWIVKYGDIKDGYRYYLLINNKNIILRGELGTNEDFQGYQVISIDKLTGKENWKIKDLWSKTNMISCDNKYIYYTSENREFLILDENTGEILNKFILPDKGIWDGPVCIANGEIYFITRQGSLYCYR